MKGVTPIIAIIILLIITITLAGAAYSYLGNYLTSATAKVIQIKDAFCDTDGQTAKIFLQNIGTQEIDVPEGFSRSGLVFLSRFDKGLEETVTDESGNGNNGNVFGDTLGLWHFDEGSGQTANDKTNWNNDGTLTNGPSWVSGNTCISGNCLQFDGVDDYVNLGSNPNLDVSTFTIDMWIKPLSLHLGDQNQNIIMGRENYLTSGFRYGIATSGQVHFWTDQSGGSLRLNSDNTFLSPGNFYHLIVTYDGTTQTGNMYINGNLARTATGTYFVPSGINLVINGGIGGTTGSNSIIDEVAIYNRSLTAAEVSELYNSKKAKFIEWKDSRAGKGMEFDGVDDNVTISNSPSLTIPDGNPLSVEFWFNPSKTISPSDTQSHQMFAKGSADTIGTANSLGRMEVRGPLLRPQSTTDTWNEGIWYHIAVTLDAGGYNLYVNGNLEGTSTSTYSILRSISNDITLATGLEYFNGTIDSVAIYNRVLSPKEIAEHANACSQLRTDTYKCGELEVTRVSGNGVFSPEFDKDKVPVGTGATFSDYGCDGACQYKIRSPSGTITGFVSC